MDAILALKTRRSVRSYKPDPVRSSAAHRRSDLKTKSQKTEGGAFKGVRRFLLW